MKFLIAGLGNTGAKYDGTRHNIGFDVLDELVSSSNATFQLERHAHKAEIRHKGKTLVLIKHTTFMNLSGKAINYWLQAEKIPVERLLVITDDLALPFGTLRMRGKGSDGGHNGLAHIIQTLGHAKFARIRFGIGSEFSKGSQVNYVLSQWTPEELETLNERIKTSADMALSFCQQGLDRTMGAFNGK